MLDYEKKTVGFTMLPLQYKIKLCSFKIIIANKQTPEGSQIMLLSYIAG